MPLTADPNSMLLINCHSNSLPPIAFLNTVPPMDRISQQIAVIASPIGVLAVVSSSLGVALALTLM